MGGNVQHIVVHAGFHKTGTTALQRFLQMNGPHLWPHMALVLPHRINHATRMATLHSSVGDLVSKGEYKARLVAFLETLDIGQRRHLVICAENMAGLIPGRNGHPDYSCMPVLLAVARDAIQQVFGKHRPLEFHLTTRKSDDWLRSCYWQNLRSSRLTMEFETFAETFQDAADFTKIIEHARQSLGSTPLYAASYEDLKSKKFGPADRVVNAVPLPADVLRKLSLVPNRNITPDDSKIAAVLAHNRLPRTQDWAAEKEALLKQQF